MRKIEIVLPKGATTSTELKLVELSRQIRLKLGLEASCGLGGLDGYGYDYENDIFMMKPYCWCEKEDCKWCYGDNPNFLYKQTNAKIWWYKWIGRSQKQEGELPENWFEKCLESIWKDDKYKAWYEFEEENGEIFVTLCFNVFDKKSIIKAPLSPFAEGNYQYWDFDFIIGDIANAKLSETKEYKKALELDKKYPALREKIKEQVIKNCKEEIKRLENLIKAYERQ